MAALGQDATDAKLIAEHLIDCELRGLHYGGLARAISIAERIKREGDRRRPVLRSGRSAKQVASHRRWQSIYSRFSQ